MKRYGITQSMLPIEGLKFGIQDLSYIQQGIIDNDVAFVKSQLPDSFTATTPVIIEGCVITKVGDAQYNYTAGTIYYNGMFYTVFAGIFNASSASVVPKWDIATAPIGQFGRNSVVPVSTGSVLQVNIDSQMLLKATGLFDYDKTYTLKQITALNAWSMDALQMVHSIDLSDFTAGVGKAFGKYAGWALADGANGRPDLRGRFVVGRGTGDYANLLATGGAERVTLSANQSGLRQHAHGTQGGYSPNTLGSPTPIVGLISVTPITGIGGNSVTTINVDGVTGRDGAQPALESHENRPPFIVVGYLVRVQLPLS